MTTANASVGTTVDVTAPTSEGRRGRYWRSAPLSVSQLHRRRFTDLPTVWIRGFDFHALSERQTVSVIIDEALQGRGGRVVTPNLHILRLCCRDPQVAELVKRADIRTADGMPLVWSSRLQKTPLPERVAGSSLIHTVSEAAANAGLSVFFLGGNDGTADATASVLKDRHPSLKVAGTYCPPFGFENDADQQMQMYQAVIAAEPDIVFVGLGCPKQERVMDSLFRRMPEAWYLGVGYSFSFVAGETARAPRWMQQSGLEWLHRLASEPTRLARRYLIEGIPFFAHLVLRSVVKGLLPQHRRRPEEQAANARLATAKQREPAAAG